MGTSNWGYVLGANYILHRKTESVEANGLEAHGNMRTHWLPGFSRLVDGKKWSER